MKLYRFSPIKNEKELLETVKYTHFACYKLCRQSFGKYLLNAGNIGTFSHYDEEFKRLTKIRERLTELSDNVNQKYFKLHNPIVIPGRNGIPKTTYTYLYIRKPDPYRSQTGDVDFYLEPKKYEKIKLEMQKGKKLKGARIFERPDLDMIELFDPDVDALGYVSTEKMSELVRVKQSDITKL